MQSGDGLVKKSENLPFNHVTHAMEVAMVHGVDVWPSLEAAGLANAVRDGNTGEVSRSDYYRFIEKYSCNIFCSFIFTLYAISIDYIFKYFF